MHVADGHYLVPMATARDYIDVVLAICAAEDIRLVVPTIDDELELFGAAQGRFSSRGIAVAVSPESTSRICNDKFSACEFLRRHGVPAAQTFLADGVPASPSFPLFIKPRTGR